MTENEKQELKDMLLDAQEKLVEAIELLDCYVKTTGDQNADAYLVAPLSILASADHPYLSKGLNIDDLIKRVDEEQDD